MLRLLIVLAVIVAVPAVGASDSFAQPGLKAVSGAIQECKEYRGPGFYLSWVKILACWLVFLAWVGTTDWVSRDGQALRLKFRRWNPVVFGCFMGAFVLVWLIPNFWIGFTLLVIAYIAPLGCYVHHRNARAEPDQRVMTRDHIRYWLSVHLAWMGIKIAAEKPDPHETGPPVKLRGRGGADPREDNARLLAARQNPGMRPAREILADGLSCRASAIMLDYSQKTVGVRFMVDGVWLNRPSVDRKRGDPALEALKILCGLNPRDRRRRQEGAFTAESGPVQYEGTLTCQGTKTGERAVIRFQEKQVRFENLDQLAMHPKVQERLKELLNLEKGFLLFSAMPAAGLRSTLDVALRQTDRLTRDFVAVEEETGRYREVENIPVTTYNAAAGQSPADVLPQVFRTQPNVVVVRDLPDGKTVDAMCRQVTENRLMIGTLRAKDSAEALLRVLATGVAPAEFSEALSAVLCQRLVRKLCEKCKEAYTPPTQVLKQLGIPEGRIQAFYRPKQSGEKKKQTCRECGGIGYKGRIAIFELLTAGAMVRKVLATAPKLDLLRRAARKEGMKTFREEGILLVAKGVTSLPELVRVLKQ